MKQKNSSVLKNGKNVIAKTVIALLILILMVGCGGKGDISKATLVGYDASSFEDTMEKFIKDNMDSDEVVNLSYGWKKGWIGEDAPDSDFLTSDERAMTYVISVNLEYYGEKETNRMIFYMTHNIKDNTLSVQGGSFDEDGEVYPMDISEARDGIEEIFDEYN